MKKLLQFLLPFVALLTLGLQSTLATHNRAGEIRFEQIGQLTIRATIITYTKASSELADRDSVEVNWGDGNTEWVRRSNGNGNGVILPDNDIKFNLYIAEHTYAGRSTYTISMTDPNRNGGILNVNPGNSESVPFYIESTFTFLNPQFQGFNNSAILLQPPIDFGCVGKRFIHNPSAYDPDGDSLAYELIVPKQSAGSEVPRYSFPNQIGPGGNNTISLNERTGDFVWESPQIPGEYNIAIRIKEYRGGQLINSFIRDLQINIRNCDNEPPQIEAPDEICVVAGDTIDIPIVVTDPDRNPTQRVRVQLRGGPFNQDISPAEYVGPEDFTEQPLEARMIWATRCEHIMPEYYSLTIRAEDDFFGSTGLTDLKTIRIKVVGPPPKDLQAEAQREEVVLNWEQPYACESPEDESFRGFTIWRRDGSVQFQPDSCQPDLATRGYEPIAFAQQDQMGQRYIYIDRDVTKGRTYCYRITAEFAEFTPSGFPFNISESLPSNEICIQLKRDIPLITNVSVETTGENEGTIRVQWVPPLVEDLDTIENPGPYRYQLERSQTGAPNDFQLIPEAVYTADHFSQLSLDTQLIDEGLNTIQNQYYYRISFYAGGQFQAPFGISEAASSVYLNSVGKDRTVDLEWEEQVPWNNFEYIVYRKGPSETEFDSIALTSDPQYTDQGIENQQEYCYFIRSRGRYGLEDLQNTLLNDSQISCVVPIDSIAPCLPAFAVDNICNDPNPQTTDGFFDNELMWNYDSEGCNAASDLAEFNIFYTSEPDGELQFLAAVDADSRTYTDVTRESFRCYTITTLDSLGNESRPHENICVDVCPAYELPNTFTPNGDGHNDEFIPRVSRFVDRVDFSVFNRWGNLVFETQDPNLFWDGTDLNGNPVPEGTYFYKVDLFFSGGGRSSEDIEPFRQGYIEIIR